ncbi:biotin-dependent carboxyltransferase family protein [Pseudaestuariivita rosea]|uniref:5-oxoprolinase subunit C family protein n=1 Tax=Pseudaestuariivita rosea TaxID=2763263 RepID=UPI001ABA7B44|nr:biotin-dependent carboxyltransferase family protein [Pseudaestuariivita rosea]
MSGTAVIEVISAGPALTLQDLGRPGYVQQGVAPGGAADPLAILEATALLSVFQPVTAIEMPLIGGAFRTNAPIFFALTGAPMQARIDDQPILWNASHWLQAGQTLQIGSVTQGTYGYLSITGTLQVPPILNSRSNYRSIKPRPPLTAGDTLEVIPAQPQPPLRLPQPDRFDGGCIRVMPGPQSDLFPQAERDRLAGTAFTRSPQANRQGVRLDHDGPGFLPESSATLASDFIKCGDVQITGDGAPYVLLADCQTIGGYPRIGTVVQDDIPKVAQAPAGAPLNFQWLDTDAADALYQPMSAQLRRIRDQVKPLIRDPRDISDLLSYDLISGVTDAKAPQG